MSAERNAHALIYARRASIIFFSSLFVFNDNSSRPRLKSVSSLKGDKKQRLYSLNFFR